MNTSLNLLPLMPFDPAWVEQKAAFLHADPRMAKAYMKLLFAAWRGSPAGSVPCSHSYIAEATGLPIEVVSDRYEVLTEGFDILDDARLHHLAMTRVCARMVESYGPEIESFTTHLVMVAQSPEQFSLVGEGAKPASKLKGKVEIPADFSFDTHPKLQAWVAENGYPAPNQQRYIVEKFINYSKARADKWKDWPAAFKNWVGNEMKFGNMPPSPEWPEGSPQAIAASKAAGVAASNGYVRSQGSGFGSFVRRPAPPTKAEQALEHNMSGMANVFNTPRTAPRG